MLTWQTLAISQHVSLSGHDEVAHFEWRLQWRWIDKNDNSAIIASLKSDEME